MLCRFRFLTYIFMLIPLNVNIPNSFTNICFITNTRSFINLAHWVRVLLFQRKQTFKFLSDLLNGHLKLLIGELTELWQESFSNELILWVIWNLHQYWFFHNFKIYIYIYIYIYMVVWCIHLLVVVFHSTYTNNLWWHHLWKVMGNLRYQFDGLASFCYLSLTIYVTHCTNLHELHFACISLEYLKTKCGVSFLTLRCTLVVIELLL